jgi:L-aminopeptidase/D-esterase-like protein
MAMMAHDGIARAVRPAHTPFDGDTIFALASGAAEFRAPPPARPAHVGRIGAAAADCMARAIARAAYFSAPRDQPLAD